MSDPTEKRQVELPDNVFVECPKAGKRLIPALRCNLCEHYVGMVERFPGENIPFAKRYMVGCRHPFARALFEVELNASPE
jgi:hypothetical protein